MRFPFARQLPKVSGRNQLFYKARAPLGSFRWVAALIGPLGLTPACATHNRKPRVFREPRILVREHAPVEHRAPIRADNLHVHAGPT